MYNSTFENITVTNNEYKGFYLQGDGNTLTNSTIKFNGRGSQPALKIQGKYNKITKNNITDNYYSGIEVWKLTGDLKVSDGNEISQNNISSNKYYGIIISSDAAGNIIEGNIVKDNRWGINVENNAYNNVIENNMLYDGILVEGKGTLNNVIRNNTFINTAVGVRIASASNTKIEKNNFSDITNGIQLAGANGTVIDSNIFDNYADIVIEKDTTFNTIPKDNVISNSVSTSNAILFSCDSQTNNTVTNYTILNTTRITILDHQNITIYSLSYPPPDPNGYVNIRQYTVISSCPSGLGFADIVFHYSDKDITGYSESGLVMLKYNITSSQWVRVPSTLDKAKNEIKVHATEEGIYAPMINKNSTAPVISLSTTSIDFGNLSTNESSSSQLVISNTGNENLAVTSITLTGDTADFSVSHPQLPATIPLGDAISVNITFSPKTTGDKIATLKIESNDPNNPSVSVVVIGTGKRSLPDFKVSSLKFTPSEPKANETVTAEITVENSRNKTLSENVNLTLQINSTVFWKLMDMNGKNALSLSFNFTAEEGRHAVVVTVDPQNRIEEINEENNQLKSNITVRPNETVNPVIILSYPDPIPAGSSAELSIKIIEKHPKEYKVYRNGSVISSGSYEDGRAFNVTIDTSKPSTWIYKVYASDTAGNNNTTSAIIRVVDENPPSVNLISPTDKAKLYRSAVNFVFSLSDDYSSEVDYDLLIDGLPSKSGRGSGRISVSLSIPDGNHEWGVIAEDDYGNQASSFRNLSVTTKTVYPAQSIPGMKGGDGHTTPRISTSEGFENETAITGVQLTVKAKGNTTPINISIEAHTEPPYGVNATNESLTGFYLNVTSDNKNWYSNVSYISIRVYYNYSAIKDALNTKGITESDLRLLRYTNGKWVKLEAGSTLDDGTRVFDAGVVDHTNSPSPYVWTNVSRLSVYGVGFELPPPPSQPSKSSGGTGGGGGGGYVIRPTPPPAVTPTPEPSPTSITPVPASTPTPKPTQTPTPTIATPTQTPTSTPAVTPTPEPSPSPTSTPEQKPIWKIPGFEAVIAIAGVVIAYMLRRRR